MFIRKHHGIYIFQAGKALNVVVFVISITSQLIYFYDAQSGLVEKCIDDYPTSLKVLNPFLFHFF